MLQFVAWILIAMRCVIRKGEKLLQSRESVRGATSAGEYVERVVCMSVIGCWRAGALWRGGRVGRLAAPPPAAAAGQTPPTSHTTPSPLTRLCFILTPRRRLTLGTSYYFWFVFYFVLCYDLQIAKSSFTFIFSYIPYTSRVPFLQHSYMFLVGKQV